jgi:[NiFe] hydrogenase large subunit/hydrogenase large subunit
MRTLIREAKRFVKAVYIPDLLAVASFYKDWAGYGTGVGNYLAYGEYPEYEGPNASLYFPRGVIRGKDLSTVEPMDPAKVTEYVTHSWYEYSGGDDQGLHPYEGETSPNYTGPEPPYDRLQTDGKYSWLKSPRYDGLPMEVGPLSRMLVAYASGHPQVQELVGYALGQLGVGPEALFSTLGRVAWAVASWRSTTIPDGTPRPGRRSARVPVSMKRRAAHSATGCASVEVRSRTTKQWFRALGTGAPATPPVSAGLTKKL